MFESDKISVIMGAYNCADTVAEAIECIISQTYTNWELIVCDDGSTDRTFEIVAEYREKYKDQIILLKNERNEGLNYTLNQCLKHATGKYIARMDGDDRCSPNRLECELEVIQSEEDIDFVSSDMQFFSENKIWGRISHPEYPQNEDFLHESPFCHAPCLVKKDAYDAVGGYSENVRLLRVEDYHLWVKMYSIGLRGKNIHKPLYQMRDDMAAYKRRKFIYRINEAYVRVIAIKELKLPYWKIIYCLRPIIIGLLPEKLYNYIHKRRLRYLDD